MFIYDSIEFWRFTL